ncbi:MAG: alkaline phosphatase family protein [Candidatus Glassbacteria bacterium]
MDSSRKRTGLFTLTVAFLALSLAGPIAAQDYDTENVILVSVDGIRCLEAFEFDTGDAAHPYIPFIYDSLATWGTVFMEMYNDVCTFTSPGHATMLTGAWQMSPNYNYFGETFQTLAWEPTIFEYTQKDLGFDPTDTWCIVGKTNCLETNYSIHPEYGEDYGAFLVQVPTSVNVPEDCTDFESIPDYDAQTVDALLDTLDSKAPALVFVNLRSVDEAAHLANQGKKDFDYDVYIEAIRRADRQVARIWHYIFSDPDYEDITTLIVTTDHGRHEIARDTLGFTNHGGICHGCRHVMCVVVGPDTPDSTEVSRRTLQVDIAPTIMELLGGDGGIARYAEGQVLSEAIDGYSELDRLI